MSCLSCCLSVTFAYCAETAKDTAIDVVGKQKTVPKLSNSTILRSRHYLTLNVSETVRDTNIVTMEY